MEIVLLYLILICCFLNLAMLVVVGAFLVQFRERVNVIFGDLIDAIETLMQKNFSSSEKKFYPKTWDEKYEYELNLASSRMSSNLQDLPDPTISWGNPPKPVSQEGLVIKNS